MTNQNNAPNLISRLRDAWARLPLVPRALALVWEAARAVRIPVVGMGGIATDADAVEFIIAGASAVAVGTANFTDPSTALRVVDGLEAYLVRHGMDSVRRLVGSLKA